MGWDEKSEIECGGEIMISEMRNPSVQIVTVLCFDSVLLSAY